MPEDTGILHEDDADESHIATRSLLTHMLSHVNFGWNVTPVSPFDIWLFEVVALYEQTRREAALLGFAFIRLATVRSSAALYINSDYLDKTGIVDRIGW